MFSTGTSLASKTPKKFKKMSVSYLVPVLLSEKGPKKKRQNEFSTRYRFQNSFLFVDYVAGTK